MFKSSPIILKAHYFLVILFWLLVYIPPTYAVDDAASNDGIDNILKSKFTVEGYYRFELGFRYVEPRSITKMRNTLLLHNEYRPNSSFKLRATSWAYYDLAYDLFNYDTIVARYERESVNPLVFVEQLNKNKDSNVTEFRELFADFTLRKFDIRIGLQHVVWGVLEGVRIVDEINPMNFRELILPDDLMDYRVPLWTFKLNHYHSTGNYEFLMIPDVRFHKPAPKGSEWELFQEVPNTLKPKSSNPRNWEVGLKWSKNILDTDLSLSYFYTWDDFPAIHRHSNLEDNDEPIFFPTYHRLHMFGTTFSRQLYSLIFKWEFAYVQGKYFGILEPLPTAKNNGYLDETGEFLRDHIRWGVGFDMNIWGWEISPSFVRWEILDYDKQILQTRYDDSINMYIRKPFTRGNSTFTLLWINLRSLKENYVKPRLNFRITDHYQMSVGLDIFSGRASSFGVAARTQLGGGPLAQPLDLGQEPHFFGNFNNNDRLMFEMRYTF